MFYGRFVELCKARGMSPAAVAREIGLSNSSTTTWKRGAIPKGDTLQKLADYFGVSVDYLLSGGEIARVHLANGIHICKNTFPFADNSCFDDFSEENFNILYKDAYFLIAVEKDSRATKEELESILDMYVPHREKKGIVKPGDSESRIAIAVGQMDEDGKRRVADYAEDILPRYRAETAPESPPAPQEGRSTTPPADAPETPPEVE